METGALSGPNSGTGALSGIDRETGGLPGLEWGTSICYVPIMVRCVVLSCFRFLSPLSSLRIMLLAEVIVCHHHPEDICHGGR